MKKQVFLSNESVELIVLDSLSESHQDKMMEFRNDPQWGHHLGRNLPYDRQRIISYMTGPDQLILGITLKDKEEILGFIMLRRINQINGTGKTTTFVSEKNQGKGYGTQALRLLLDYAFQTLNLRKINADVFSFNDRNVKRLLRLGFQQQGLMLKEYYINGEYCDDVLLCIFKEVWQRGCK
jgi:RimJ/RimL family protein N-acetyltransferase